MELEVLRREIKSIETLVSDGIIKAEKGELLKDKVVARFMAEYDSTEAPPTTTDFAHLPGRLIGGVFDAMKHINGARCAGVDEDQPRDKKKRSRSPNDMMDGLPEMYK